MSVKVITISRQFGSGGRTVGRLVAERMGWEFYDKELVRKIAAESGWRRATYWRAANTPAPPTASCSAGR